MFNNLFGVEGLGDEVVFSLAAFSLLTAALTIYCFRNRRPAQVVHPSEQENMDTIRETMAVPRRRYENEGNQCPICLNEQQYQVETNCGHVFCCPCLMAYRYHGSFIGAVRCPVCRQQIKILFQCFTENELGPEVGSDQERERDNLLQEISNYNRRFSGEPRPYLDYLRDLPTLSRHFWSEFFSVDGLFMVFRLRILFFMFSGIFYLLSPLDIIPEAVFGLFGYIDDAVVLLSLAVYLSILYHNYIALRA